MGKNHQLFGLNQGSLNCGWHHQCLWLNHVKPWVNHGRLNPLTQLQPVVATAVLNDALNRVVTELVLAVVVSMGKQQWE